jgi:hypothetical protein
VVDDWTRSLFIAEAQVFGPDTRDLARLETRAHAVENGIVQRRRKEITIRVDTDATLAAAEKVLKKENKIETARGKE